MVEKKFFGKTKDNQDITCYKISVGKSYIEILDYGCTIHKIVVPNKEEKLLDVCLGYDTVKEYEENDGYLGAVIGRYGNRIKNGKFLLNNKEYVLYCNDGKNHLHGGKKGFDKYIWNGEIIENGVRFFREFPDGDEGYPGNLKVWVTYEFKENHEWVIKYEAESDKDTILNLTNHCYFNLNGNGIENIKNHFLRLDADFYTKVENGCLPTGEIVKVDNSVFDFRNLKQVGQDIFKEEEQLKLVGGYDHNFVLNGKGLREIGELFSEQSGIDMKIYTTQPGIQIYSGNVLTKRKGKNDAIYDLNSGICLETQHFPDSMEHSNFPSVILHANEKYQETTIYKFSILK